MIYDDNRQGLQGKATQALGGLVGLEAVFVFVTLFETGVNRVY
jgi:hypothetical protein